MISYDLPPHRGLLWLQNSGPIQVCRVHKLKQFVVEISRGMNILELFVQDTGQAESGHVLAILKTFDLPKDRYLPTAIMIPSCDGLKRSTFHSCIKTLIDGNRSKFHGTFGSMLPRTSGAPPREGGLESVGPQQSQKGFDLTDCYNVTSQT